MQRLHLIALLLSDPIFQQTLSEISIDLLSW